MKTSERHHLKDNELAIALQQANSWATANQRNIGMIVGAVVLVFVNLSALYYALARWLFLRDTGRKLTHVDRQLIASEGVHEDLPPHLWSTRG